MITRIRLLLEYTKDKEVLDIGSTGNVKDDSVFLFGMMSKQTKSLIGIDIDEEFIKYRQEQGYNIIKANAEEFDLGKQFQIITAYEIMEHLSNIGNFLSRANKHLKDDGLLLIETDNAYRLRDIILVFLTGKFVCCKEHTAIFAEDHINELLRRAGFEPVRYYYYGLPYHKNGSLLGNSIIFISYLFGLFRKRMRATILCVARKRNENQSS